VADIPTWHASLHWGALLRGQVVSDHAIDRPVLHVTRPQAKKEMKDRESVDKKGWQEAVLALYPLEINLLTIADAEITYLDNPKAQPLHITDLNIRAGTAARPPYRVFLTDTNIGLANVSNQLSEGTAHIKVTGEFMGSGPTQVSGTFRPETKSPDFDLTIRMVRTKMQSFNDVLRAYGDFDVVKGAFSVFTELKVKDGTIKGYVKPLFKNVEVYDPDQDRDKGLLQTVFEGVISGVTDLLKNTPREEVATKVDVSGPVKHPKASTWQIVVNLIQNAFFKAILPGFEKEAKSA
jgi:hypothetical protein